MKDIAIFASGSGSNAKKIIEYFADHTEIKVVQILCNNPEAGVIEKAENLHTPCRIFDKNQFKNGTILSFLKENNTDYVVLAGFLWLIPKEYVAAFPNKIINLHPALLPKYGGKGMFGHHVHEAVIENKEKESGITIHFVNEAYDEGAIIFQAEYKIEPYDSPIDIALKGQKLEHRHFPEVIEKVILNKGHQ